MRPVRVSEFQASQDYVARPRLKNKTTITKEVPMAGDFIALPHIGTGGEGLAVE